MGDVVKDGDKITVVPERCIAAGNCTDVAPEYFDQRDDDGTVVLLEDTVASGDAESVEEAIDICPVAAILAGLAADR